VDIGFHCPGARPGRIPAHGQPVYPALQAQEYLSSNKPAPLPADLPREQVLFKTRFMVPRGFISNIRQVVFISPQGYEHLAGRSAYEYLRQALSQLNSALESKQFICVGPGHWGTDNPRLGIDVSYADVYKNGCPGGVCTARQAWLAIPCPTRPWVLTPSKI